MQLNELPNLDQVLELEDARWTVRSIIGGPERCEVLLRRLDPDGNASSAAILVDAPSDSVEMPQGIRRRGAQPVV